MFFFAPSTPQTDEVNLVDIDRDGVTEFLNRGHHLNPVILFDAKGRVRWKYDLFMKNDAAAGDMNGDGRPEIVVGFGGGEGVHLLDSSGKRIWQKEDGNVWRVEMLDTNDDGKMEIVHSNAGGELTARDFSGKTLWVRNHDVYVGHFSLTRWADDAYPRHILALDDGAIHLFDRQGNPTTRLEASGVERLGDAFGTTVRFSGREAFYATIIAYPLWDRSLFFIHGLKGQLLFKEVIPSECSAILALPKDKFERLLVGCTGKVLEYSPLSPEPKQR
jgi:hypothetical protein